MAGYEASEWIAETPESIFDFMLDTDNAPKMMTGVIEMVKRSDGPIGVGTQFHETRRVKGQENTVELEVTAHEPPRYYAVKVEQSGITVEYRYTLASERNGTRIDLTCVVTGGGLKKLMLPIVAAVMKREDGDHLRRMKSAIEQAS